MIGLLKLFGAAVPWRAIGIGAGALAMCGAVVFVLAQGRSIGRLKAERDAAIVSATANTQLLEFERSENARILAAQDQANATKIISRQKADAQRRTVFNAKPSDDGPIAPVLRRQLDELPKFTRDDRENASGAAGADGTARP